eukprot:SAG22_NODE_771_length_7318_cov_6.057487_2_plen_83_part_00
MGPPAGQNLPNTETIYNSVEAAEQRALPLDGHGISEALAAADRRDGRKGASLLRHYISCPRGLGGRGKARSPLDYRDYKRLM